MIHELKCSVEYFAAVANGDKKFELRKNDRNFQTGDILHLLELDNYKMETGRFIRAQITYILENYTGLKKGYAILSLQYISKVTPQ